MNISMAGCDLCEELSRMHPDCIRSSGETLVPGLVENMGKSKVI